MQKKLAGSFALQTQIVEPVQVIWTGSTTIDMWLS